MTTPIVEVVDGRVVVSYTTTHEEVIDVSKVESRLSVLETAAREHIAALQEIHGEIIVLQQAIEALVAAAEADDTPTDPSEPGEQSGE